MEDTIKLNSSDNENFTVSKKGAMLSKTIKELIEDLGEPDVVPVKVTSSVLKKVVEWMDYMKDSVKEEDDKEKSNGNDDDRPLPVLNEFETKFCEGLDDDFKVDIMLAANYLEMKYFLDIVMISTADLVKGCSPEELRKVLERTEKAIPEDLSEGIPGIKKPVTKVEELPLTDGEPANKDAEPSKRKR